MRIADTLRIESGDVVTLVGGGGKTTVMFRLAEELTAAGLTVISTMTTKIFVGQMERAPDSLLLDENGAIPAELPAKLARHQHVLIGGRITADLEKVEGVPPEIVDRIAAGRTADVLIVEADGSRRLPFKAPADHEPVVPRSTTVLVPLAGMDVLGQPLDAEHIHRPQLVSALAGAAPGERVTPQIVARVLAHAAGGAKGLPPSARLVPFLNKADLAMDGAREIARLLLQCEAVPQVADEIVIGAAETAEPVRDVWGRVAGVVLAAGEAKRFGQLKQVMPWRGKPLIAHVVEQALACSDIARLVVTTGAYADQVETALGPHLAQITQARVEDWRGGQSRSVQTGLRAAGLLAVHGRTVPPDDVSGGPCARPPRLYTCPRSADNISAAIFLLADQPGITPALLSALIQRHRETLAPVVAPRNRGRRGNPVLFDRKTFPEFKNLEADVGARSIIREHEGEIAWVDWPTEEILKDIDTPEDYVAAQTGG